MSSGSECPDTENLKISPFAKGEWRRDERVMLDVAFTSLAEVLGDEDDPLESISALRLLAIAYAIGWSDKMLTVTPVDFAGELESAIDARGDLVDIRYRLSGRHKLGYRPRLGDRSGSTRRDRPLRSDVWND